MLRHSNMKPYLCGLCRKAAYYDAATLRDHIKICGATRQFQCDLCGFKFKIEKYLRQHMKSVHGKDCVFQCDECPLNYRHAGSLSNHKKRKHKKV